MATLHGGDYDDFHHGHDNLGSIISDSIHSTLTGHGNPLVDLLFGDSGDNAHHVSDIVHGSDITSHAEGLGHMVASTVHDAIATADDAAHSAAASAGHHDAFVFTGGGGQEVTMNFQQGEDMVHIARNINGLDIHSPADVAAHVTANADGHAVVDLGHGDSITLHGVSAEEVQHNPHAFFTVA